MNIFRPLGLLVILSRNRVDLFFSEFPGGLLNKTLFVAQLKVHGRKLLFSFVKSCVSNNS